MATHLKPGDPAPDFEAPGTDGKLLRLTDFRGRKLVLYFYPMDDTPGCTKQACSLRDSNAEIAAKGAAILGVSAQGTESHQRFTEKFSLNFPLLAVFNVPGTLFGVPVLYAYFFLAWAALVALMALVIERGD